jgi:NAD-dependent dihydropyrimidine dehydrogenase PreA subunit
MLGGRRQAASGIFRPFFPQEFACTSALEPRGPFAIIAPRARRARHHASIPRSARIEQSERIVMAHVITEPCIGTKDTKCVEACPVNCIHPMPGEAGFGTATQLFIDPEACIDCGLCVDECPVQAIFPQDDVPAEWRKYIQINADHFKK